MTNLRLQFIGACSVAVLALGACATSNTENVSETAAVSDTAPIVATKPLEVPVVDSKSETRQAESKTDKKDPNRRVCKRQKVPGSNLKKRVCATAARWEEEEVKAREFLEGVQKNNRINGTGN